MKNLKKYTVLTVLFVLPLVAYLFFSRGVNNFVKLSTLQENVLQNTTLPAPFENNPIQFDDKITLLHFMGEDVEKMSVFAFNLKEKVYDRNKEFNDFQVVSVIAPNQTQEVKKFLYELNKTSSDTAWKIASLPNAKAKELFDRLKSKHSLNQKSASPYVFIIDKKGSLRGRTDDEDEKDGLLYAYNSQSVAELNNKMVDDVKVILAEYRLSLKKFNKGIDKAPNSNE